MVLDRLFRSKEELDLTGGPIGETLFYLSLPIVVINLLRTAYNLADTFWVGKLSDEALAGITFGFPLVFLFIALGMGVSVAGSVLVAQYEGGGRRKDAGFAASQTVTFTVIVALVLGALGYVAAPFAVPLLGAEPAVQPLATVYLQIISLGIVAMFGFSVFIALLRGYGDTVTPMLLMFGSVLLNIVLDPFLIFGWSIFPRMGIAGAAVATIFTRGLAFVAGLAILFRGHRGLKIRPGQMVPDLSFARRIVRIGGPASLEMTGRALSFNLLVAIVGMFSTPVVAGYGVGVRLLSLLFLPADAISRGVETMTGQNVGASEFDRARRTNVAGAKGMFLLLTGVGALTWLAAPAAVRLFSPDPEVVRVGTEFLRYVAPTFGFVGIMRAFTGGFRGVGKTLVSAAIIIGTMGVVRIPVAWVLATSIGPSGIWLAGAATNVVGAGVATAVFLRDEWTDHLVSDEERMQGEVAEEVEEFGDTIGD